jgi:hypothetical protein
LVDWSHLLSQFFKISNKFPLKGTFWITLDLDHTKFLLQCYELWIVSLLHTKGETEAHRSEHLPKMVQQ